MSSPLSDRIKGEQDVKFRGIAVRIEQALTIGYNPDVDSTERMGEYPPRVSVVPLRKTKGVTTE